MNEQDTKTAMRIAQLPPAVVGLAYSVGVLFCIAGGVIGLTYVNGGFFENAMGFAAALSGVLPTLGVGLLLIFAGRILRVVTASA